MLSARNRRISASLLLPLALFLFLAGCTDHDQAKQDLLQAVAKQEEVKSYKFSGSLELNADTSLLGQASPMTTALFAMIKESKIDYSGVSSLEASRMESDLKVTPKGADSVDMPVLIKDNKLFFHMPALNQQDEYMVLPVQFAGDAASDSPGGAERLKNTGRLTAAFNQQLLSGIDAKWLQPSKDPVTLSDGTTGKRITVEINSRNEQAFAEHWQKTVPGFIELLKTHGLASDAALAAWQSALQQIQFKAPTTIDLTIDSQGYVREQKWNLHFTSGASTNKNQLVWTQSLAEINQAPAFTRDTPEKQKSIDELLKLARPTSPAKP
ncbi:hypothetical protein [Paenibacillus xerothermodurans]|uniref:Uncharacterized protein n=1 Tax=Paenibacillus xerothermodurans TaxID=1977292 RepID=A0A2W1P6I3_PAEXE|nr:hypothetical protein [Paenibacillus xerothermodurans]PZE22668.1 hypothetical protein CBW46_002555 [Paenibacillus xerothermodurans]